MDFTQTTYKAFIEALKSKNYSFSFFEEYIEQHSLTLPSSPSHNFTLSQLHPLTILRHDVDRLPQNSLKLAQLEHSLGIKGSYYFRIVPESYNLEIMNKISELGHEIGYHYEDVDLVLQRQKIKSLPHAYRQACAFGMVKSKKGNWKNGKVEKWENGYEKIPPVPWNGQHIPAGTFQDSNIPSVELIDAAYESFCKNLEQFRKHFDIKTICMHGSPRSKYDNKIIWEKYNYKDLGLIGEPYFDIDFDEFAYFTDTGRRWNGQKYSVRDRVVSKKYGELSRKFRTTQQIIDNIDKLPDKVMFTIHPERWHSRPLPWVRELVWQNAKNVVKKMVVKEKR